MTDNELRHILAEEKISAAELARRLRLHTSTVQNWANGKIKIPYTAELAIFAILGKQPTGGGESKKSA